jgi:hypothetical protein
MEPHILSLSFEIQSCFDPHIELKISNSLETFEKNLVNSECFDLYSEMF